MSLPHLRRAGLELVAASFIVLAFELTLIRWIASQVRVTAYFPNLVLISAFLGLGLGCLWPRHRIRLWMWPVVVTICVVAVTLMSGIVFTNRGSSEFLWLWYRDLPPDSPVVNGIHIPIIAVFVLGVGIFVPLGSFIAERLQMFRDGGKPLIGYACDLLGSLAGVVAMSLVFFAGMRPVHWFAIILAAGIALFWRTRRSLIFHVLLGSLVLVVVHVNDRAAVYSPYYAISYDQDDQGQLSVMTNGSFHQIALPLARSANLEDPTWAAVRKGYHLPYRLLGRPPRNVLVLGAGTGNDVAVALDEGAQSVDAVEIDPEILKLGRLHPHRPYESDRVTTWNTDARAFLNYNEEKYDLIVFGTLDSMTRLSALSNVRLDNYVYTVECLRAAREHLTPDGGIVLYFAVGSPHIEQNMVALVARGFEERPHVIYTNHTLFTRIYLGGPAFARLGENRPPLSAAQNEALANAPAPTDDWPYLYLEGRQISSFYLSVIAIVLAIAVAGVFLVSREMRRSVLSGGIDIEMFLFGVAFLLLETKLVTEMSLVWGATWITSAVVFGSILLMVLIGTVAMARWQFRWSIGAIGLILSLIIVWLVPVAEIVGQRFGIRLLASLLYAGGPIAFSSICFAILFRERLRPDVAFGWNMLGAVAGGLLEFSSMLVGIKAMTLLALTAYLLAILSRHRRMTPASSAAA